MANPTFETMEERLDLLERKVDALSTRLDGLRQFMEQSRNEDRRDRASDRGLMEAILRDHNRGVRAIERLERRRAG